ncbi:MAG: DMT family transporter [Thermoleophilaceae bacterium]
MTGRVFAVAAGVAYGTLGIFSTLFYDHGGTSFSLLVLRFCGGAVIFLAIALARRRPWPARREMVLAIAVGPAQFAATVCLFVGFEHASPGLVVLLFYIYPLLVTLGAGAIFGEELGTRRAVLLGLGTAGIVLTVGAPDAASGLGIAAGLGAGASTAVFILASRHLMMRGVDAFQFVALAYSGSALAMLLAALVNGVDELSRPALGYGFLVVTAGTVVPALFFYSAIRLIGAGGAARLATIEPLTAVVLSFLVLGDSLSAAQIAGGAVLLTSVVLLATSPDALGPGAAPNPAEP